MDRLSRARAFDMAEQARALHRTGLVGGLARRSSRLSTATRPFTMENRMEPGKGLVSSQAGNGQAGDDAARVAAVQEQIAVGVNGGRTGALRVRRAQRQEDVEVPMALRSEQAVGRRVAVNRQVDKEFG